MALKKWITCVVVSWPSSGTRTCMTMEIKSGVRISANSNGTLPLMRTSPTSRATRPGSDASSSYTFQAHAGSQWDGQSTRREMDVALPKKLTTGRNVIEYSECDIARAVGGVRATGRVLSWK